jgi:hypothetical protein
VKLFGRDIRYSPEETATARWACIMGGDSLRKAATLRWYNVTTEDDRFEKYRLAYGFWGVIKIHLVLGFGYLFRRLKLGWFRGKEKLCQ